MICNRGIIKSGINLRAGEASGRQGRNAQGLIPSAPLGSRSRIAVCWSRKPHSCAKYVDLEIGLRVGGSHTSATAANHTSATG
jgi:hypothetical protein